MSSQWRFMLLLFMALLLGAGQSVAHADEPEPEPPPGPATPEAPSAAPNAEAAAQQESGAFGTIDEQVQERLARARTHFSAGRYDDAIVELQSAYKLKPNPNYLFSIGQSHRRAGRHHEALDSYRRFLKESQNTPLRVETTNYITELTTLIRQQEAIELERRRPVWKKPWFWGVLGSSAAALALGIGLGVGLRDTTETIGFSFGPGSMTGALSSPLVRRYR
jgi:tetratricopeptide (TPR) repeat protein